MAAYFSKYGNLRGVDASPCWPIWRFPKIGVPLNQTFFKTDFPWTKPSSYWGSHSHGKIWGSSSHLRPQERRSLRSAGSGPVPFHDLENVEVTFMRKTHGEITATTWDVAPLYLRLHLEPQAGHNFSLRQNFRLNRVSVFSNFGWENHRHKKLNQTFQNGKWLCKMIHLDIFH